MDEEERKSLIEANKRVHSVETEWHYRHMVAAGFEPDRTTAVGLVRSYTYTHPVTGYRIRCATGYSADHWEDVTPERSWHGGYASGLEAYLRALRPEEDAK